MFLINKHSAFSREHSGAQSRTAIPEENRKALLSSLHQSADKGRLICICSPTLGEGAFLTFVQEVCSNQEDPIIVFHPVDFTGRPLLKNIIHLSEIAMGS